MTLECKTCRNSKWKTSTTTYNQLGQTISRTTKDGKETFEWDPWGNLITLSTPNYTWKASYDALGRRLQTTYTQKGIFWSTSTQTTSLFDPEYEFQEIGVKYNNQTFWKLYGPTSCEAIIDNQGNALGLFQDALGSLKAILSSTNTHWIEELPSPYGPTGPPPNLEPNLLSFAKSHTWQGNRQDPTGLVHLGARHYDPKIGRFLSPDPISFPTCLDLYTYANNDPINFRDPSGRFSSRTYKTIVPSTISAIGGSVCGLAEYVHPIGEFTLGGIDFFGSFASHVGASDLGFSTTERLAAIPHIEAARVNRWDTLDRALLGSFSNADPSDTIYHDFRNGTRKGLVLGSIATGVTKIGLSVYQSLYSSASCLLLPKEVNLVKDLVKKEVKCTKSNFSHSQIANTSNQANGKFYSIAFETEISATSYPGVSRGRHFQEANSALLNAMEKNPQFSQMIQQLGINLERTATGLAPRTSPSGWTWHHAAEPGVMQLVPRTQHTPGSIFWDSLHPGGQGGYSIWGQ